MTRQLAGPTGGGTAAIVVGTALGGLVGFYVMHHAELRYKERLRQDMARLAARDEGEEASARRERDERAPLHSPERSSH
ncbi:unnamed protein product [Closterium sp. Naga37s-1]|nr:unnamed protein product [Closterium sp. Naga37s-1]